MISAGNDIVALQAVDIQRTQSPAFYSKFIIPAELALYQPDEMVFVHFVWLLWSVKESAYKYLKREDADLVFSPTKLTVQQIHIEGDRNTDLLQEQSIDQFYNGIVSYGTINLPFRSAVNNDFIASTINDGDVAWAVQIIDHTDYESQSKAVRLIVLAHLDNLLAADDLWIQKHPAGYPVLFSGNNPIDIPISFAHHDHYVSYSFQIPK